MYDSKVVRRRRAALAIFVVLSVAILTMYFGESGGGVFHTLQRGAQEGLAPLETGTSRALKPFRDLFGWFGDTLEAQDENEKLRGELEELRKRLAENETGAEDARQLRGMVDLAESEGFPEGTEPLAARVIARSPTVWYSTVKIDKGSSDGVREDQPVIAAGGLAGKVTRATDGTAEVTLITDASSAVSAEVLPDGANGVIKPDVGEPEDLLLDFVEKDRPIRSGNMVVTSGFTGPKLESIFPRGIPIGKVTRIDPDERELYQRVHIEPYVDFRRVDTVQVITTKPRDEPTDFDGTGR